VKTGAEAIRALATQLPSFRQKLNEGWYQVRIAGRDAGENELSARLPGSYSAIIDMPSGRGSVTLEFKVFHKGNQWAGNITDCTVIVTKKVASGISIR
jgi:predicted phage tail protein